MTLTTLDDPAFRRRREEIEEHLARYAHPGQPFTIFLNGQPYRIIVPYAPWPDFILDHADQHSG